VKPEKFLKIFSEQFEENAQKNMSMNTPFKQLQGWSSLQALMVTVAIHDECGVSYTDEDIRNSQTINDLFLITKNKLQA